MTHIKADATFKWKQLCNNLTHEAISHHKRNGKRYKTIHIARVNDTTNRSIDKSKRGGVCWGQGGGGRDCFSQQQNFSLPVHVFFEYSVLRPRVT